MRLLHGELSSGEAAELRRQIDEDPELAREYGRLERAWNGVPPARPAAVPLGFPDQVVESACQRRQQDSFPAWSLASGAIRWAGIAVAAAGIAIGSLLLPPPAADERSWGRELSISTLADSYWELLAASDELLPRESGG